jgi:hypothetical protein
MWESDWSTVERLQGPVSAIMNLKIGRPFEPSVDRPMTLQISSKELQLPELAAVSRRAP